ncbi:MAG: peptidoglycan editing factor PgeF [Rhodomicrobium sp.]|nr:peptidoglycan editing factor PgeF [Rhodomicrobium sp.]
MIVSDLLKQQNGVRHGFFTRRGGVSKGLYRSLNCGLGSNDDPAHVHENRLRAAAKLGAEPDRLLTMRQVHSARVISVGSAVPHDRGYEADAMVTRERGLAIGILTADCTPILFADMEAGVIGAAHAGWRGAKAGIIVAVVEAMEALGARRSRIYAAIGPAISQPAYEVGAEFEAAFAGEDEANRAFFRNAGSSGKAHFDLTGYCTKKLQEAGVGHIENLGLCTYADESLFFSYRRATHRGEPDYGRQISAIVLM